MSRVLVIPDTQAPFHHPDTIKFLKAIQRKYKTNRVVHIGDEVDQHALGDYDHDPDGYSAGHELIEALKFMKQLYRAFPVADVCISNHTARIFRRAFKHGIPKAYLKDYHDFLEAPKGWSWWNHLVIDGVRYEHGEGQSGPLGAIRAAIGNQCSTVIGHLHANAGIQYHAGPGFRLFGFNVGCMIDAEAYAFKYGRVFKSKPVLGCGVVIDGHPIFEPYKD